MSDLKEALAQAVHDADCGCTQFYQRHEDPAFDDEYYQKLADAALAVVQKRAEQLADVITRWIKDVAYSPDDIVLGPFTTLDKEGLVNLHRLLDIVKPDWRSVFGLATREETNHG